MPVALHYKRKRASHFEPNCVQFGAHVQSVTDAAVSKSKVTAEVSLHVERVSFHKGVLYMWMPRWLSQILPVHWGIVLARFVDENRSTNRHSVFSSFS